MTAIPGFGPKKAILVYRELGIEDLDALVAAANDGRLRGLKGFSAKTEESVLRAVERASRDTGRVLIDVALDTAENFLRRLRTLDGVRRAEYAGSLRRMAETIGDVDLLVASDARHRSWRRSSRRRTRRRCSPRRREVVDPHQIRLAGRPPRRAARGLGGRDDLLHRVEGAQRSDQGDGRRKGLKLNEYGLFRSRTRS
jgi:DNA polymerase/3'-5' exonuclease PolX